MLPGIIHQLRGKCGGQLRAMRNLLRDLKANLLDNQGFRKELEKILLDPALSRELRDELSALAPKQP